MVAPKLRVWLGVGLLLAAVACAPANVSQGPLDANKAISVNGPVPIVPTKLGPSPVCTPSAISIKQVVPACVNLVGHEGGVSFEVDATDPNSILFDQSIGNVTCKAGPAGTESCTGPAGASFVQEVCTFCAVPNSGVPTDPTKYGGFACANGYVNHSGVCDPASPSQPTYACPPGTRFDNALQNCVDQTTHMQASPCPPGFPYYVPDLWLCTAKPYPQVNNCQYFPMQLGVCKVIIPIKLTAAAFCQNRGAKQGGVTFSFDPKATLLIDVRGSRLEGCSPPGSNPVTCWGPVNLSFKAQLCTDPNKPETCTSFDESLGDCPAKAPIQPPPSGGPLAPPRPKTPVQ